jgi:hypothetical protein
VAAALCHAPACSACISFFLLTSLMCDTSVVLIEGDTSVALRQAAASVVLQDDKSVALSPESGVKIADLRFGVVLVGSLF